MMIQRIAQMRIGGRSGNLTRLCPPSGSFFRRPAAPFRTNLSLLPHNEIPRKGPAYGHQ